MTSRYLREQLTFNQARIEVITEDDASRPGGKNLYLKGICIEGDKKNANERIYPRHEILKAVETINEQIRSGNSVLGEVDHPDDLKINLDRVCHSVEGMWMDGHAGCGKLKILPTPMGELIRSLLTAGVKLGVSSRGSGNVDDRTGHVSDFEIVTIDVVAQPSAPNAYPQAIYEGLMNMRHGHRLMEMARESGEDNRVRSYLGQEIKRLIRELKI